MGGRRDFLRVLAAASATPLACKRASDAPKGAAAGAFPEKASDLILHTDRPVNLETPLHYFRDDLTPNEAFFVRWHLPNLPKSIDLRSYRLAISGHVDKPQSLLVSELKSRFAPTTIVAVNQCSGNSRAAFEPRVPGVQWRAGAMGNAKWTGVRLRELLDAAGVRAGAVCATFAGLDRPQLDSVPLFVKSLPIDEARADDVLVAYAMNDAPLPMLNGFPLRLVLPGYFSTYWVKALDKIEVLASAFEGFWMQKAYRIPTAPHADESPTALAKDTVPIARMTVRSFVVRPEAGESLTVARPYELEGIAFDGGTGIRAVEVSTDGGATFQPARLDADRGKYSFRRWRATWTPSAAGPATVVVRATNNAGDSQREAPGWNRAGYLRNVYERVDVKVVA